MADNSPYVKPSPAREQEMQEVVDRLVDADTDEEDDKREWVRPRPPTGGTVDPDSTYATADEAVAALGSEYVQNLWDTCERYRMALVRIATETLRFSNAMTAAVAGSVAREALAEQTGRGVEP